ncbi:MAG: CsbD family protein [Methylovirgula sp.]
MSSSTDKIKGLANETAGHVKRSVGKAVGSERLQAEGVAQELKGHVQKAVGDAKSALKGAADKAAHHINKNA